MGEGLSGIQIEGEDMRGENVEEEGGGVVCLDLQFFNYSKTNPQIDIDSHPFLSVQRRGR